MRWWQDKDIVGILITLAVVAATLAIRVSLERSCREKTCTPPLQAAFVHNRCLCVELPR